MKPKARDPAFFLGSVLVVPAIELFDHAGAMHHAGHPA